MLMSLFGLLAGCWLIFKILYRSKYMFSSLMNFIEVYIIIAESMHFNQFLVIACCKVAFRNEKNPKTNLYISTYINQNSTILN